MIRLNSIITILIVALAIMSCKAPESPHSSGTHGLNKDPYEEQTRVWEEADIRAEVESALDRKDFRFLCVTGEGVYAPGLSHSEFTHGIAEFEIDKSRFRIIDKTYDEIDPRYPDSHRRFKRTAENYARKYNLLLKQELTKQMR
jgi:hypothetical protein